MQQIINEFEKMKQLIAESESDMKKFTESGNKAAGTRVRKNMQEIKNLGTEIRKLISEAKNDGTYKLGGK